MKCDKCSTSNGHWREKKSSIQLVSSYLLALVIRLLFYAYVPLLQGCRWAKVPAWTSPCCLRPPPRSWNGPGSASRRGPSEARPAAPRGAFTRLIMFLTGTIYIPSGALVFLSFYVSVGFPLRKKREINILCFPHLCQTCCDNAEQELLLFIYEKVPPHVAAVPLASGQQGK